MNRMLASNSSWVEAPARSSYGAYAVAVATAIVAVFLVLQAGVPGVLAQETSDENAVRTWLQENAIRLATVEAGHGFADLQPLRRVVGNARIVALGEATHGSREFFQLKHRVLEFLVNEMGFDVFAMETTMPEAFDINRYVLTGRGDARKALAAPPAAYPRRRWTGRNHVALLRTPL